MAKILIIEDSEIQRNWAKEELAEHEVTFLECYSSRKIKDLLNTGTYDLALTDLIIPSDYADSNPTPNIGRWCFEELLKKYTEGLVGGVAIVSNFEHHLDEDIDLTEREISDWFSFINIISRKTEEKKKGNQANILIWVDLSPSYYEYFMTEDGTEKSIAENGISEVCDFRENKEWGEITLLKPWKKIVSTLLS